MNISPEELKRKLDEREKGNDQFILVDVRNPNEQEISVIPGTDLLIPLPDFDFEISKDVEVIYTDSDAELISGQSQENLTDKRILSYSDEVDSSIAKY